MNGVRMIQLLSVDEEWGIRIFKFMEKYNEFEKYLYLAPLTRHPVENHDGPKNVFEEILHCICSSGVRSQYGIDLFKNVRSHLINHYPNVDFPFNVPNQKRKSIVSLIDKILYHHMIPEQLTYETFNMYQFSNVFGVGETTVYMINAKYGNDYSVLPLTDRTFQKGMKKLYGNITITQMRNIAERWDDKQVAIGMIRSISHYG
jgi:hypothetical protein